MVKTLFFRYYLSIFMAEKTLIISLVYYPEFVGGAEVAVKEITDRSPVVSFDMITLIGSSDKRVETVGNIRVIRVGFRVNHKNSIGKFLFNLQKYFFPLLVYRKGRSLFKEHPYHTVWSIMANYAGFGALLLKLRMPSLKFLLTLQEGDPISYIRKRVFFVYPLFKLIFKKADMILPISHYLADFARSMGGNNIHVLPNGVDLENFRNDMREEEKRSLKETLGIQDGNVVLVTTSRLVLKNGMRDVIVALSYLPEKYKFLIIGDGELREELIKLSEELNVSSRVSFVGFLPHNEIPLYFSVSDIFIRTSLSEGLGNSFLEAMAFGLPVIATPVGGIVDIVQDGVTGLLVPPKSPEKIKEAILRLEDKQLADSLRSAAKTNVVSRYDWNHIAQDVTHYLKSL